MVTGLSGAKFREYRANNFFPFWIIVITVNNSFNAFFNDCVNNKML